MYVKLQSVVYNIFGRKFRIKIRPTVIDKYNGYRVSFPEVQQPCHGIDHTPSSSNEVKTRVQL